MSEKEKTTKSSKSTSPRMKHGEEPTGLLLALVYSPIETLLERGIAEIYTAEDPPAVVIVLKGVEPSGSVGFQIANTSESSANTANTANTSPDVEL